MAAAGVGISISLEGLQGQIVGGMVVGPLGVVVAAAAAAFANPFFHRMQVENEVSDSGCDLDGEEEEQHYYLLLHHRQPHSMAPGGGAMWTGDLWLPFLTSYYNVWRRAYSAASTVLK